VTIQRAGGRLLVSILVFVDVGIVSGGEGRIVGVEEVGAPKEPLRAHMSLELELGQYMRTTSP
jgi:hypothetical protein